MKLSSRNELKKEINECKATINKLFKILYSYYG